MAPQALILRPNVIVIVQYAADDEHEKASGPQVLCAAPVHAFKL